MTATMADGSTDTQDIQVRLLDHRDVYRNYFAVVVEGVDYATTDTAEKAEEIAVALRLLRARSA